ncbi:hypothetical protein JW935_13855 [candidate division KSB1 bacterium]|nr:hypothetical protein [candidate division KSB1 bacterium]
MTQQKKYDAGQEIEALCNKCKCPTVHVIEVVKENKVTRVICKICHNSHRYKPATKANVEKVKKKISKKTPEERKWSRLMAKTDEEEDPIEYSMEKSYDELAVIEHHKFGIGVVKEVLDSTKMNVVFQDGIRTLVQNR